MKTVAGGEIIGENLKIDNRIYTVIGYLDEISAGGLRSFEPNEAIFVHLTTLLRVQASSEISNILAKVREGSSNDSAKVQVNEFFVRHPQIKDVLITSPEEMIAQMEKQMKLYTLLLGAIGSISLIVGGVGVMNVMLVSVAERRREIGIRRALGAKRADIKSQFLIESMILSLVGGVLGILLGLGVSFALAHFAKWQFSVSYAAVMLGFGVSSAVGIFFGYYPAHQASKLDPIIALRSD
jgi:putative ABC transport system permease protein